MWIAAGRRVRACWPCWSGRRCSVPDWQGLDRATAEALPLRADGGADRHGPARVRVVDCARIGSGYLLVFEIISVHLLVVLIGRGLPGPRQAETEPRRFERMP